jgi:hypothetical protein
LTGDPDNVVKDGQDADLRAVLRAAVQKARQAEVRQ